MMTSRRVNQQPEKQAINTIVLLRQSVFFELVARNALRNDGLQAPALGTLNTDDSRREQWQGLVQLASCHVQMVTDQALAGKWYGLLPQEMISDLHHVAVHPSASNRRQRQEQLRLAAAPRSLEPRAQHRGLCGLLPK